MAGISTVGMGSKSRASSMYTTTQGSSPFVSTEFTTTEGNIFNWLQLSFSTELHQVSILLTGECQFVDMMAPEYNFPIETSSNKAKSEGLRNPDEKPWKSAVSDDSPSATITLGDENRLITEIVVSESSNIASITAIVLDKDGQEVIH